MGVIWGTGALDSSYGSYFWPSGFLPSELLNNPWVIFIAFFAIFFSVSFFSLSKAFKGTGKTPAAVISLGVAFLMAAGIQGFWPQFSKTILIVGLIIFAIILAVSLFGKGKNVLLGILVLLSLIIWLWPIWSDKMSPFWVASNMSAGLVNFLDSWHFMFFYAFLVLIIIFFMVKKEGK